MCACCPGAHNFDDGAVGFDTKKHPHAARRCGAGERPLFHTVAVLCERDCLFVLDVFGRQLKNGGYSGIKHIKEKRGETIADGKPSRMTTTEAAIVSACNCNK